MVQQNAEGFDVSARRFHQAVCVVLLMVAFVVGPMLGRWLVLLVGLVMLVGRFWWPADIFRQLAWRVLEPAGILRRHEEQEDHATRRVARVTGGTVLVVAGLILGPGHGWAWLLVAVMDIMIFLDAAFSF